MCPIGRAVYAPASTCVGCRRRGATCASRGACPCTPSPVCCVCVSVFCLGEGEVDQPINQRTIKPYQTKHRSKRPIQSTNTSHQIKPNARPCLVRVVGRLPILKHFNQPNPNHQTKSIQTTNQTKPNQTPTIQTIKPHQTKTNERTHLVRVVGLPAYGHVDVQPVHRLEVRHVLFCFGFLFRGGGWGFGVWFMGCVYVCERARKRASRMHIYTSICISALFPAPPIHTHTRTRTHTHTHARTHIYTHKHTYIHTHQHTHIYIDIIYDQPHQHTPYRAWPPPRWSPHPTSRGASRSVGAARRWSTPPVALCCVYCVVMVGGVVGFLGGGG
jgi:hypothetical protein